MEMPKRNRLEEERCIRPMVEAAVPGWLHCFRPEVKSIMAERVRTRQGHS